MPLPTIFASRSSGTAAHLEIKSESYAPRDPVYFRAGRDFATPKKGRVMADVAIDWVADKMQEMIGG